MLRPLGAAKSVSLTLTMRRRVVPMPPDFFLGVPASEPSSDALGVLLFFFIQEPMPEGVRGLMARRVGPAEDGVEGLLSGRAARGLAGRLLRAEPLRGLLVPPPAPSLRVPETRKMTIGKGGVE